MKQELYPILEFDKEKIAVIEPTVYIDKIEGIPEYCVIAYFREAIEAIKETGTLEQIGQYHTETVDIPIYKTVINNQEICLVLGFVGGAGAAGLLEELYAKGIRKVIVCGGGGVLKEIAKGHLIVPTSCIRDEGASYHYLAPSREVSYDEDIINIIEKELNHSNIPYTLGKTWTTDAFYRETRDKVNARVNEGAIIVEMEASSYLAVAKFREIKLGQILYGGDSLAGENWDSREWNSALDIRRKLIELSIRVCLTL